MVFDIILVIAIIYLIGCDVINEYKLKALKTHTFKAMYELEKQIELLKAGA